MIVVMMQVVVVDTGVISVTLSNRHQILRVTLLLMKAVYHMILDAAVSFAVIVDIIKAASFVPATVVYVEGISILLLLSALIQRMEQRSG